MFQPDTVDGLTSGLHRTVHKLKSLSEKRRAAAVYHNQLSVQYSDLARDHNSEADKADRVAGRINGLLEE